MKENELRKVGHLNANQDVVSRHTRLQSGTMACTSDEEAGWRSSGSCFQGDKCRVSTIDNRNNRLEL